MPKNWNHKCFSSSSLVKQSVPQGSVLGSLLFILYVNGLCDSFVGSLICQYADDTSVVLSGSSFSGLSEACSGVVKNMQDWCTGHALKLNPEKTSLITFSETRNKSESLLVRCNHRSIPEVEGVKFLGVQLDSTLNWEGQTVAVTSKLNSFCALFRRLRSEVSTTTLRQFYFASVQSLITYSIMFWGSSRGAIPVFIAQKRIVRTILRLTPRTSCRKCFVQLGFITVTSLYFQQLVMFVKKHQHFFNRHSHFYVENMTAVTRGMI